MASFVIHHIAGVMFLKELEEKFNISLSEEERVKFLLGNLIVDSSKLNESNKNGLSNEESINVYKKYRNDIQEEKIATHFRSKEDLVLCTSAPVISKFISKYDKLLDKDISTLGYLFHLYTDVMFFRDLFNASFRFLDKDGNETLYNNEAVNVKIIKNNKIVSLDDFWNGRYPESIYVDYTTMNKKLLEYYHITFDDKLLNKYYNNFINPGITEVDYKNATNVVNQTVDFIKQSYSQDDKELNIFDEKIIKSFVNYDIDNFIKDHQLEIDKTFTNKVKNTQKTLIK